MSPVLGNISIAFFATSTSETGGIACLCVVAEGANVVPLLLVSLVSGCCVLGESPGPLVDVSGGLGSVSGAGTAVF